MLSAYFDVGAAPSSNVTFGKLKPAKPVKPVKPAPAARAHRPPQPSKQPKQRSRSKATGPGAGAAGPGADAAGPGADAGVGTSPQPAEAGTYSVHAKFEPLQPNSPGPRPAEPTGQAWQALRDDVVREDDVATWQDDQTQWEDDADADADIDDDGDEEPNYEPESLDPLSVMEGDDASVMSSSLDAEEAVTQVSAYLFFKSRRQRCPQTTAVYSGPQLCCEDEDFD